MAFADIELFVGANGIRQHGLIQNTILRLKNCRILIMPLSPLQETQRGNKWSRGEWHSPTRWNTKHD